MAEVKFGVNEQPAVDVAATVETVQPATPVTPAAPAEPAAPAAQLPAVVTTPGVPARSGLALGDEIPDFKDIILPRLNIVQNIGGLKDSFPPGALVFNQQMQLFVPPYINAKTNVVERQATPPVIATIIGFKKTRYSEKVSGGVRGQIVDSEAAVAAAGGTLDYGEWKLKAKNGVKLFEPLADCLICIQRPESVVDDETVFTYPVTEAIKNPDGTTGERTTKYALALWAMHGTVYTNACKKVFFPARAVGCLRKQADGSGGYPTWSYAITTREETYQNGNKAWIPICIPTKKNSPEFLDFVRSVLGQ